MYFTGGCEQLKRVFYAAEYAALVWPPLVLFLCAFFDIENAALLSILTAGAASVPFFWGFEKRKPAPEDIMPVVIFAAIAAAGRAVFAPFPNFKPVSAVIILGGASFGRQSGYMMGALAALASNMLFGQGPWTPWQMYAWGLIGYFAGVFDRRGWIRSPLAASLYGFFASLVYGLILDSWHVVGYVSPVTLSAILAVYAAGAPFSLSHAAATAIMIAPVFKPFRRKMERIKSKYAIGS